MTQIASVLSAFVLWCYLVRLDKTVAERNAETSIFFLEGAFFLAVISFLILFFRKMTRFSGGSDSVTVGIIIDAELVLAAVGSICLIMAFLYGAEQTPWAIVGFSMTAMAFVFILHFLVSSFLHKIYNLPRNRLKVLVVGMNHRTKAFCQIIKGTSHLGAEVHGYLDAKQVAEAPVRYLGKIDDLGLILRSEVIDMTAIFLPIRSYYDTIDEIIETCGFYGVTSYLIGNVFDADLAKRVPTSINDMGNMAYSTITVDYAGLAFKRIFDFLAALAALVVISPLLAAIAIYIKFVSPGPIIFRQERIGLNKRSFQMMKFRTMIPDAEKMQEELAALNEMDGAVFKITNDPRLIRGGSFLRRHSLDELPQLWNVLRGEMSLVGPRPLSRRDYDLLKEDWQRKRFSMRPGLTCIWQVSPSRNSLPFMEWMQMDLDYIDRWSLGLDCKLVLQTVKTVLVGSGK